VSTTDEWVGASEASVGAGRSERSASAAGFGAARTVISIVRGPGIPLTSTSIAVAAPVQARFETQVYRGRRRTPVSTTDEWVG
jgi:hypothetical protein